MWSRCYSLNVCMIIKVFVLLWVCILNQCLEITVILLSGNQARLSQAKMSFVFDRFTSVRVNPFIWWFQSKRCSFTSPNTRCSYLASIVSCTVYPPWPLLPVYKGANPLPNCPSPKCHSWFDDRMETSFCRYLMFSRASHVVRNLAFPSGRIWF